jgi:hypothetical protein
VVPNSWLGIDSGFNLRRNFVEQRCLRRLTHYQENPFPTQGVEVVSFWLVKPAPATTAPTEIEVRLRQEAAGALLNSHCISYQQIAASPNMGIPLQQSVLRNSASKLPETTLCLGDARSGFDARIALQAYALGKGSPPQTAAVVREHSFHCESAEDASCVPYLEGKDIAPFNCSWSGEYLRHGPWLAEAQPLGRFTGPRLVLREVLPARGAMLCATYLEQPYLYNKSVLHILPSALSRQDSLFALSQPGPQQSSTVLLKALLSVLTSSFGSEWFYSFGRKAQRRLFPKLVLADLRDFPLPKAFYQEAPALAQLADQQLEYCIESQGNLCATIRARCNQLVAELYQLSGQQRKGLEQQSGTPLTSHSA